MPAVVACPKCEKKFKLPDNMLGKGIKCPSCGAQFKTPAPRKASAAQADPRKTAAKQQALAQQTKALKAMGVEGTIERPPDVFAEGSAMPNTADPLANHMVQDPGFGEGAEAAIAPRQVDSPDDPFASMFSNPALAKEEKKKRKAGKAGGGGENRMAWWAHILCGWQLILVLFGGFVGGGLAGAAYGINVAIFKTSLPLWARIILVIIVGFGSIVAWLVIGVTLHLMFFGGE